MKKLLLSLALTSCMGFSAYCQNEVPSFKNCGTVDYYNQQKELHPEMEINKIKIEQFTQEWIQNNAGKKNKTEATIVTIPVVVHVVYNTATTAGNISDAQIQSQINILNADYSLANTDFSAVVPAEFSSLGANVGVQFCLASIDPDGNATSGITRNTTTKTSFSTNDYVKYASKGGADAWNSSKYLNLWVCKISGGIIGYAQFPGGAAATDGVVIDYRYFGNQGTATAPYNLGRTATHEVGHWLNLYHIWGDDNGACSGTDYVDDTPNQSNYNFGCPTYPHADNCSSSTMFMNYMDYVDDACMAMFSAGQAARCQALFASGGARESLLSSNGCGASPVDTTIDTTTTTPVTYCASKGNKSNAMYLKTVTLGSYSNNSGNNNGYADFTSSSSIALTSGSAYTLSLVPGFGVKAQMAYSTVWIDYNNNGSFDDAGEKVAYGQSKSTLNLLFTVPSTVTGGLSVRMRIAMKQGAYSTSSCETFTMGEVEDYKVTLSAPLRLSSGNENSEINVYPNPAKSNLTVEIGVDENSSNNVLRMIDLQGREVVNTVVVGIGSITKTIDLSAIPAGIYILSVKTANYTSCKKVVVEK